MSRTYRVVTTYHDEDPDIILAFGVTDISDAEFEREKRLKAKRTSGELIKFKNQEEIRPRLATFEVSGLYGQDEQNNRAWELCDYMNKMRRAMDDAVSQHSLMDVLTAGSAQYKEKDEN